MDRRRIRHIFPFLQWMPGGGRGRWRLDVLSGLTGAILVIPQGVAFAMIAGLPPVYGLYTAIVAPIVAALFSSSMYAVNGPTTAISIVVFTTLNTYAPAGSNAYVELALLLTFLTGMMQLLLGLLQMGILVNFVSNTVIVAFTLGASLLIASSQLQHLLGLEAPGGLHFTESIRFVLSNLDAVKLGPLILGLITFVLAILVKALKPKWPNLLLAMIAGSLLAHYLAAGAEGIRFIGQLPRGLPPFKVPDFDGHLMRELTGGAFALALLALIQSVAIGRSIANRTGQIIDPNREFIAQGLSNLVGSFFSNYVSGASLTRSAVNYQSGAQTPASAIIAAGFVLIIVLFAGPLAAHLPVPVMAGIILLVAYNLIDFGEIARIFRSNWNEWVIFLVTLFCTLVFDLAYAIYGGVLLSILFYLRQTGKPRIITVAPLGGTEKRSFRNTEIYNTTPCPQLDIIRIDGSLYFGAVDHVGSYLRELEQNDKKFLLILGEGMNFIDLAGAELLLSEAIRRQSRGGDLFFSGVKKVCRDYLEESGFRDDIGREKFFMSKKEAIRHIYGILDRDICAICQKRVFLECNE